VCLFYTNRTDYAYFYTVMSWSFFYLKINILSGKAYLFSLFLARYEAFVTDSLKLGGYQHSQHTFVCVSSVITLSENN